MAQTGSALDADYHIRRLCSRNELPGKYGYFLLALVLVVLNDWVTELRREQYGAEPLDQTKMATLAAQFFEMLAQLCRGRIRQAKGRYNLEVVGLVKKIQEHQTEAMTAHELREALAAAGVAIPEGEAWRIWLWRARRSGLIPNPVMPRGSSKKMEKGP